MTDHIALNKAALEIACLKESKAALKNEVAQLKARVAELSESLSTTSNALHNASLFILAYDEALGDDYGASACKAWTVLKRKEAVPVNTVKTEKAKPMPSIWEVGMMVEYVVDMEWGPRKGSKGRIVKIRDEDIGTDAREYQVFWVEPLRGSGRFWTTPSDIKWISDEAMLAAAEKEHVNQVR